MRVLFLTLYPETAASPRYRVHQFLPYLRAQGIECVVASAVSKRVYERFAGPNRQGRAARYHLAETPRRIAHILSARRYNVVFVQKALMSASLRGVAGILRASARRIVYDIDDAVHLAPPHSLQRPWHIAQDDRQIDKVMAMAEVVLAGNAWLANEVKARGGRPIVWPTVVDTARFTPARQSADTFRIGWIGGPSTTVSLRELGDALAQESGVEFRLVGADSRKASMPDAAVIPWRYETEVAEIQRFSAGIMPLPKTEWSRGKCALKALQYMACGVPCVATPFGAVTEIIRDGENGLLADSPREWRDAIERLRDPALRRRLGEAGRETVAQRFALDKAAPVLGELLISTARQTTVSSAPEQSAQRIVKT